MLMLIKLNNPFSLCLIRWGSFVDEILILSYCTSKDFYCKNHFIPDPKWIVLPMQEPPSFKTSFYTA